MAWASGRHPRETFDEVAEVYDRARPRYPTAVVGALAARGGLSTGSRVCEIGPGTGVLSVPLARRGYAVTGVELGPAMAAVATRNLAPYPDCRVRTGNFETWLPPAPFDMVVCAASYHWLDRATRLDRTADALRDDGTLAVVTTRHVDGGTSEFFALVRRCYQRWDPDTPPRPRPPAADELQSDTAEFEASPRYGLVTVDRFTQDVAYTAASYLDLLRTYADHRLMPPAALSGLLGCVRELIDGRYGGRITKRYLHEVITARRTA
jgi:SAM-dependent methyltransferase